MTWFSNKLLFFFSKNSTFYRRLFYCSSQDKWWCRKEGKHCPHCGLNINCNKLTSFRPGIVLAASTTGTYLVSSDSTTLVLELSNQNKCCERPVNLLKGRAKYSDRPSTYKEVLVLKPGWEVLKSGECQIKLEFLPLNFGDYHGSEKYILIEKVYYVIEASVFKKEVQIMLLWKKSIHINLSINDLFFRSFFGSWNCHISENFCDLEFCCIVLR